MKRLRPILWGVAILVTLLVVVVVLAFNSSVQTWATRRVLAEQHEMKAGVGKVDAGLKVTQLTDIAVEKPGFALKMPSLLIEMPLMSAAGKTVSVKRLVAKGWRIDLSAPKSSDGKPLGLGNSSGSEPRPGDANAVSIPRDFSFDGVLRLINLPVDFSLDQIDMEGEIFFRVEPNKEPARAVVRITGGNLGVGSEGRFTCSAQISLPDPQAPVSKLEFESTVVARMDSPRTFEKFTAESRVRASGSQFPDGATLQSSIVLNGGSKGESYVASLQTQVGGALKNLFRLDAAFPFGAASLSGRWKLDVDNKDILPFALGLALPVFAATGEGAFESDSMFKSVHAGGTIDATAEQLAVLLPQLAAVGKIRTQLDFDLLKQGSALRVERFAASVAGNKPIASVQALQKFEYDLKARTIKVNDASAELLRLTLHGLPLTWIQPLVKDVAISGDDVRGEFFASARNDGFAIRPSAPISISNLSLAQAGRPLVRAVELSIKVAADSSQQGWQVEVADFVARSGPATLVMANFKAGQPAGSGEPIKVAGQFEANLPALLAQPAARDYAGLLNGGVVKTEFSANLDGTKQISAAIEVVNLSSEKVEKLPKLQANVRADIKPDGKIQAQVPIVLDTASRKSDVELGARIDQSNGLNIEADVVSNTIYVQDLKPLQALAAALRPTQNQPATQPAKAPKGEQNRGNGGSTSTAPDRVPFWNACTGQLKVALKEIVYSSDVKVSNVNGLVKIDAGTVTIDGIKAEFGGAAEATLQGKMNFDGKAADPYTFDGSATVTGFDPAPFFKAANPQKAPTVEGKFDVSSKLSGSAPNAALLASKIKADLNMTSRGGVFRGLALPSSFAERFQGKSGNLLSSITGAVGALAGGNRTASAASAAVELTSLLAAIPFDQLNLQLSHDAAAALTNVQDFTLISPTIRLNGNGSILQQQGVPLLKQPLTAQISLSSHGHIAELFGKQGMLQGGADPLGYYPLFAPIKLDGTLSEIGNEALTNLFLQKLLSNSAGPLSNLFGK
ncbi:MAG: hypothetical protein QM790_06255 [Nibricoccus sp.]